jgi:hypothetical protein
LLTVGIQTLFVPALISLAIYLLLYFIAIPFIRRYRERYSQYLPLHTISSHTSTLRERVSDGLMRFVLRVSSRRSHFVGQEEDRESLFDEEGEELNGFEYTPPPRRGASDRYGGEYTESTVRFSRELEQGFLDESNDEAEDNESPAR